MHKTGFSARSILFGLSIVALVLAVLFLVLARDTPKSAPLQAAARPLTPNEDLLASPMGSATGSDSAAVPVPRGDAARMDAPVGSRILAVSGTVVDALSGSAIASIEIEAFAGPLPQGDYERAMTISDARGHYALKVAIPADLASDPNVWDVWVSASGDRFKRVETQLRPGDFMIDPTSADTFVATRDIEIKLLLALRGRLVRESDRTPIARGAAELLSLADTRSTPRSFATATADDAGRFLFQLETAMPGELAVLGVAMGFLAKMVPASLDPTQTIDVGDIALGVGVCLEGIVTTADGSVPVATHVVAQTTARGDAWIYLRDGSWAVRNGGLVPRHARAPIGADGRFRLCGLAPDEYWLSESFVGCRTGSSMAPLVVRAPSSNVQLQLSTAVYRLRVFDAQSGSALDRAQFIFDGPSEFGCWIEKDSFVGTDPGLESAGRIVAEGHRALKCTLPALAASEVRELEFRLEPLPPGIAATIVVTSPTATAVQDIDVEFHRDPADAAEGPLPGFTSRAPDGRHVLPKLVAGTYLIDIQPRRQGAPEVEMWLGATLELHVREGMEPNQIQLVEGGLVSAVVNKTNGEAVDARTSLVLSADSEPKPLDWRNDAGIFAGWIPKQTTVRLAKPLPVGRATLRFEANGCKRKDIDIEIARGRTTALDVSLEPNAPR